LAVAAGFVVLAGYPVEDEDTEENVGVAAHETDPARFAFEHHEDGEVDD
jgi:hypothetical protein